MKDKLSLFVYLAIRHGVWGKRLVLLVWKLQQWATVPPKTLLRLINPELVPKLYSRGERLWSTKMFDKQLEEDGL